jgi:hypothetical protein
MQEPYLIAYRLPSALAAPRVVKAARMRDWMFATTDHFAQRCLPMLVANESGWCILNSHAFTATWNGSYATDGVQIHHVGDKVSFPVQSHFGYGVLTWIIPYLFRTSAGYNLLVRGVPNSPKDGVCPLEGLVETDWAIATFTYNMKLTRPGLLVCFDVDEPICMLVPQLRNELELFDVQQQDITLDQELQSQYAQWAQSRSAFNASQRGSNWEKHYFRGTSPGGVATDEHQTKRKLQDFGGVEHEMERQR